MFFVWQSLEILNVFNALTMKQVFLETKIFFQKLEYHFLVKSIKIESTTFPTSEAKLWTYCKERSFATDYFIFLKI